MTHTVVHFGPDRRDPGGMARVIQSYLEAELDPWQIEAVATYTSASRPRQLRALATAVAVLSSRRRRRMRGIHVHASEGFDILRTILLLELARRRGLPSVVTVHGANFMTEVRRRPRLLRAMLRRATAVTVLSEEIEQAVRGLGAANVTLLPNPVRLGEAAPRDGAAREVLFAGEIGRRKGVDVLLEAWAAVTVEHPDASLLLLGPVVEPEVVRSLPPNARLGGVLDRSGVLAAVGRAYAATLPSRAEAMPMFILEAMAAGVPVVATPVGSVRWVVGEGGIVVPAGDAPALARALGELLASPERRDRLGGEAHRRVEELFSTEVFARRVRELYEETF